MSRFRAFGARRFGADLGLRDTPLGILGPRLQALGAYAVDSCIRGSVTFAGHEVIIDIGLFLPEMGSEGFVGFCNICGVV